LSPVEIFKIGFIYFLSWSFFRKVIHQPKKGLFGDLLLLSPYFLVFIFIVFLIAVLQKDLGQVAARFEAGGAVVNRVVLPENTVRQVEFGIDGKSYVVRMTVDRGVEEQTDRALKAMSWLEGQGIAPSYVDARVDRNVFYK
jgi:hypothetical protein